MIKLIGFEIRKVLGQKLLIIMVVIGLCLNAILVCMQLFSARNGEYSRKEISELYDSLPDIATDGQLDWIHKELARYYSRVSSGESIDSIYWIPAALQTISNDIIDIKGYGDYLNAIEENTVFFTTQGVFRKDSFEYRNIVKISEVYHKLADVVPRATNPEGVILFTENYVGDLILLIITSAIALNLVFYDTDNKTGVIINSTKRGISFCCNAKVITLFLLDFSVSALLYLFGFFIIRKSIGFGDFGRPLQSVRGFLACPLHITVGQYMLSSILIKVLFIFFLTSILFLACGLCRNAIIAIGIFSAALASEYLFWKYISWHSTFELLKYINVFTVFNVSTFFSDYKNINIFGYPVNLYISILIITLILLVCLLVLNAKVLGKSRLLFESYSTLSYRYKRKLFKKHHSLKNLTSYEWLKLLVFNRGIMILAFFCIFQFFFSYGRPFYYDESEYYYKEYSEVLAGELTDLKEQFLEDEKLRINQNDLEHKILAEQYAKGQIGASDFNLIMEKTKPGRAKITAFNRAYSQYMRLKAMSIQGYNVSYIYETPWTLLWDNRYVMRSTIRWFTELIVLEVIFVPFVAMELRSGMNQLLESSVLNETVVFQKKKRVAFVLSFFITAFPIVISLGFVLWKFDNINFFVPVKSIAGMQWIPFSISILAIIVIGTALHVFLTYATSIFIIYCSSRIKKSALSYLLSFLTLVAPAIIVMTFFN